ncbi:MAG: phosphoribosylanthranilate isomerase [Actinobacteria bacterium]|nr:phosphoribosylanthranilate isomerase [Actinomycetota bacterium]
MTWIKICGITSEEDALEISGLGVDALGFILSTDSPRRISLSRAGDIIKKVRDSGVSAVGVFVNEDINAVYNAYLGLGLDYVQLSGDESAAYLKELKGLDGNIKILKAVRADEGGEDSLYGLRVKISGMEKFADYILMDGYLIDSSGKKIYGGTGRTFDWEVINKLELKRPLIISGGLDHANVQEAIRKVRPFGVDASSRLESSPGHKDIRLVRLFMERLREGRGF